MRGVFTAKTAVLVELQLVWCVPFILGGSVVALLTFCAGKRHDIPHDEILAPHLPYLKGGIVAKYLNTQTTR